MRVGKGTVRVSLGTAWRCFGRQLTRTVLHSVQSHPTVVLDLSSVADDGCIRSAPGFWGSKFAAERGKFIMAVDGGDRCLLCGHSPCCTCRLRHRLWAFGAALDGANRPWHTVGATNFQRPDAADCGQCDEFCGICACYRFASPQSHIIGFFCPA